MELILLSILFIVAACNSLSLAFLCDALFEHRLRKSIHWICLLATILLLWIYLLLIPSEVSLLRTFAYLFTNIVIISLFHGKLLVRVCIATIHYLIATALETIFLPIILTLWKLPISRLWQEPIPLVTAYLGPMVLLCVACLFFSHIFRRWKKQIELPVSEWLAIFLFATFTLFELYFAGILMNEESALIPLLPILGVILLVMNVGVLLLLNKLTLSHQMSQENITLQEQMRYNRLSMQATTESYNAQRSLIHDFEHHMLTMVQLLQIEQNQEALTYAKTVIGGVSKVEVAVSTNNPIADAVLNQKYRKAQDLGIQMQFLVSDLSSFPLSIDEMVTVLANLLDNALEACVRDTSRQKKCVKVKLLMEPALATISVKNTSLPVVISQKEEVSTEKKKQSEHGYGLKTCKKILQRSHFDSAMQYQDGWFQFTAIKAL